MRGKCDGERVWDGGESQEQGGNRGKAIRAWKKLWEEEDPEEE